MFSLEEQIILNNIDRKWKYIARDYDGKLFLYENKPKKSEVGSWIHGDKAVGFGLFTHLFENITWEDEEPTKIERGTLKNVDPKEKSAERVFNQIEFIKIWKNGMHDEFERLSRKGLVKHDAVNPNHYIGSNGLEAMDVLRNFMTKEEVKGFHKGNALKYLLRCDKKNGTEDLKKAQKNLGWLIEEYENK